ncbi:MAG: hypothetical protein WDN31_19630 [Hyphomicrobium sp.]
MRTVAANATVFFVLSLIATVLCGIAYSQLKPHYRLADQVPDKEQALAATGRLDAKLTGANPVHVMIRWTGNQSSTIRGRWRPSNRPHDVLERRAGLGNVWSLESLRRWLAAAGNDSIENVKHYVGLLPEHLVRRFIAADEKAVLVTARLPDVDASQILPIVDNLDKDLEPIRQANPAMRSR